MMKNQQKQQTADTETQARRAFTYGTDLSGRVWRSGRLQALDGSLARHCLGMEDGICLGGNEAWG